MLSARLLGPGQCYCFTSVLAICVWIRLVQIARKGRGGRRSLVDLSGVSVSGEPALFSWSSLGHAWCHRSGHGLKWNSLRSNYLQLNSLYTRLLSLPLSGTLVTGTLITRPLTPSAPIARTLFIERPVAGIPVTLITGTIALGTPITGAPTTETLPRWNS